MLDRFLEDIAWRFKCQATENPSSDLIEKESGKPHEVYPASREKATTTPRSGFHEVLGGKREISE
jgi:hypothetical protein